MSKHSIPSGAYDAGAPARSAFVITPDDDVEFDNITTSIFIGTGGDLEVLMADSNNVVVFKNIPDGYEIDIAVKRVLENTTATNIIGLY